ncbi:hypothetical protein C8R44DRAFT_55033 [Mycena epipterygia]|nr:hypothetical protein C8R44DRAFT_55033 [Mycena epipterygia]
MSGGVRRALLRHTRSTPNAKWNLSTTSPWTAGELSISTETLGSNSSTTPSTLGSTATSCSTGAPFAHARKNTTTIHSGGGGQSFRGHPAVGAGKTRPHERERAETCETCPPKMRKRWNAAKSGAGADAGTGGADAARDKGKGKGKEKKARAEDEAMNVDVDVAYVSPVARACARPSTCASAVCSTAHVTPAWGRAIRGDVAERELCTIEPHVAAPGHGWGHKAGVGCGRRWAGRLGCAGDDSRKR